MNKYFNSLAFKIGLFIILAQVLILAVIGYLYLERFSNRIDQQVEEQVQIPGTLMNAGLLNLDSIADPDVMSDILGEELVDGLVVGVNGNVFFALNPDNLGQPAANIEGVDASQFTPTNTRTHIDRVTEGDDNYLISISPIFQADGRTPRFFAYVKINTNSAEAEKADLQRLFLVGSTASLVVTSIIIFLTFNFTIFTRLRDLLGVLKRIETGELSARVSGHTSGDEIGDLQRSVNAMAERREQAEIDLKALNEALEERVATRTRDLRIASDVSRRVTTVLDHAALLQQVAEETRTGFELYHVSIFIYDDAADLLRLDQGTGEIAAKMRAEDKRFKMDERGLVPQAARTHQAVLSNDVTASPDHLPNPYLPATRSELALPMLVGNHLVGVLDLQSEQPNRFTEDDIRVMTTLAEQIAIAVRNAQLYTESQHALDLAEEANRVKSQFLASMSHELRTPLNAILNFTQFVSSGMLGVVNQEQIDILDKVVNSGKHLLSLINDVLDISKIESGALKLFVEEDIDLTHEIKQVVDEGQALIKDKPITMTYEPSADLHPVVGDKRRIRQIVLNLISNACKFTQEGSITVRLSQDADSLVCAVQDTGPGIPAEEFDAIFETFRQSDVGLRQGEGTGLGLPISRRLAEAHGGNLWLESEVGVGSTFYVSIPTRAEKLLPLLKKKDKETDHVA